ncbi:MAG: nitroreductase family protein [Prevotellaceae bacterium]|jgi:nitroreductase|nr:nitroreductase family protein [Prevotellaceae bacterium]
MTFKELSAKRYSVRKYKDTPVDRETLNAVLEAGRAAPTAGNRQPQRILAVTGKEGLEKLDRCTRSRNGAPAALIVCYDKNECWVRPFDNASSGEVDASIVATAMMFQAVELGLGTLWVMHFDPAKLVEEFAVPENLVPAALLILGYAADDAVPADRHAQRHPLDKLVSWGKW